MNQLLQGFQAMFDKQEHDQHDDRIDRQRFETNIQYMVAARSHPSVTSVASVHTPTGNNAPPGQYYAVPSGVTDIEPHQSTLFSQAIPSTSVAHNNSLDDRQHHNAEPPFLALLTMTSHCSKFKKFLVESVQMKSYSLASWNYSLMVSRVI
jgi:hypothetical protein